MVEGLVQRAANPVSAPRRAPDGRRIEAQRLIDLAKALLTEPEEEIAAIYLDHAVDALRAIPFGNATSSVSESSSS